MTRFVFGLETLLKHREGVEQKERDTLFRLTNKYQMESNHREMLVVKFHKTLTDLAIKRVENVDNRELSWFCLYLDRLTYETDECDKRLIQFKSEVQSQKVVVMEAIKKRKTLAAMKAKKEKAFRIALEKKEQKEIDDLVVVRYTANENQKP